MLYRFETWIVSADFKEAIAHIPLFTQTVVQLFSHHPRLTPKPPLSARSSTQQLTLVVQQVTFLPVFLSAWQSQNYW